MFVSLFTVQCPSKVASLAPLISQLNFTLYTCIIHKLNNINMLYPGNFNLFMAILFQKSL